MDTNDKVDDNGGYNNMDVVDVMTCTSLCDLFSACLTSSSSETSSSKKEEKTDCAGP